MATLTLADMYLDVQIDICMHLQPSDILTLRKVCQHSGIIVDQITEVLSRLAKLFNLVPGNG